MLLGGLPCSRTPSQARREAIKSRVMLMMVVELKHGGRKDRGGGGGWYITLQKVEM